MSAGAATASGVELESVSADGTMAESADEANRERTGEITGKLAAEAARKAAGPPPPRVTIRSDQLVPATTRADLENLRKRRRTPPTKGQQVALMGLLDADAHGDDITTEVTSAHGHRVTPSPEAPPDASPSPAQEAKRQAWRSAATYWSETVNRSMGKRPGRIVDRQSKVGKRLWRELGKGLQGQPGAAKVMAAFRFVAESEHTRAQFVRQQRYTMETALRHVEDYAQLWWDDHPPDDVPPPDGGDSDRAKRWLARGVPRNLLHLPDHRLEALLQESERQKAARQYRGGRKRLPPGPGVR
ncbi:MAG: hypothetical protein AAGA48_28710 [Myxococcota bacterium]